MHLGGIILCGGRSSRMGLPKWSLPFGPETMLERIVRLLGKVCPTLVVVAAADQSLVKLPERGKYRSQVLGIVDILASVGGHQHIALAL